MNTVPKQNLGSLVIGMLVVLVGGLALGGWLFNFSLLAQMLPGIEYMAPNTALAFVLAGAWVALAATGPGRPALVALGGAVSALAAMVLVQYLTGVLAPGGGLQILLNTRADSVAMGAFNGRMALGTAFALLLSGAAMLMLSTMRSKAGVVAAMLCVFGAGFIGMLGVISNIVDFDVFSIKSGDARMSLYTALCLVALSVALWGLSYRQAYSRLAPANEAGRTIFVVSSILLFTTLFAGVLVFSITENHAEEELRRGLARTLDDRSGVLQRDIAHAREHAEDIASRRPLFRKRLLALAEGRVSAQAQREIGEVLDNVMSDSDISALRLLNANGELMGARGAMVENPMLSVPLKGAGQAVLLWDNRYVLRVRLSITEQGRKLGRLIAEVPLLSATATLADFSGLGESGETLVCAPHMAGWMQCFPSRHAPHIAVYPRAPDALPLPMDFALAGRKGMVAALDYRKQRVIAAYAPVGELGLGQVLKMDEAEFYQPARERIGYVLPVLGAMLALGIMLIRWQVAPLVRDTVNARNQVKATLDNVAEGIVTFDEKGCVTSFNPAAGRIFGYPPEEALGINIKTMLPGLDTTRLHTGELTGRRKDGGEFVMEVTVSDVALDGGRAHIAVVRDVTQRKLAEQALRESEDRFRGTFEQAAAGMAHVAPDGRFMRVNHKLCEIVGYSREELMARTFQDITYAKDLEADLDNARRVLAGEIQTYDMEKRYIRKDGALVWINLTVSLVREPSGAPEYFIAVIEDISRRKQAEEALRESDATLKSMAANVPGMVFQFMLRAGGQHSFAYASEGALAVCGLEPAVLTVEASRFLEMINEADRESFHASMSSSVKQMAPWNWEGRLNVVNETKWINWRASPRQLPGGDILWDGMVFNITDSKIAELEIRQSREQLQNLSAYLQTVREEEKAHIAREIHDEFGGTLTALKMDTFWLSKKLPPEPAELRQKTGSMVKLIDGAVQTMRRICTELRPTILDDLGLVAAIEWQVGEYQKRTGIECILNLVESDMALDEASSIALFRILQESLTNIARYAGATWVEIDLRPDGDSILLQVKDNGVGISEDKVLNPLSHGIRGMIERTRDLGGTLLVTGAPGQGVDIRARIPLAQTEEAAT